jgi:DNA gyrase subunit B
LKRLKNQPVRYKLSSSPLAVTPKSRASLTLRTDKPILRISRRHHGNVKSSVLTQDFVHGSDYATLSEAANTFRGLLGDGAKVMRGEGERQKEEKVNDFREAMKWLLAEAEHATSSVSATKGLG